MIPIIALTTVRDEAAILGTTLKHLFAHGVDRVYAVDHGSTDGTWDVLSGDARVRPMKVDAAHFRHEEWTAMMLGLAERACIDFWCIPFDADEFFISRISNKTVGEILHMLDGDEPCILEAPVLQHASLTHRARSPLALPKVAFRYTAGCHVTSGAHAVKNHPGPIRRGLLEVRELHAPSEEAFLLKTKKHLAMRRPDCPEGESVKYARRAGLSDDELRQMYRAWALESSAVYDPIPVRS